MINTSKSPRSLFRRLLAPTLLLVAANLYAQPPILISLQGSAEVPPVTTSATGTGEIVVLADRTVSGSIKTSGLAPTMAHIHEASSGKNGPPIITLNNTANDRFAVPADARLTDAQYMSFKAGHLYVNVHSVQHPNGEIRAQLLHMEIADTPKHLAY